MAIELTVSIKDSERTFKKKFLAYAHVALEDSDPYIEQCVRETIEEFKGEPEDIKVRALLVIK